MKYYLKQLLAFTLALLLFAVPALAAPDSMERAFEKMDDFYDLLVEWHVVSGGDPAKAEGFATPENEPKSFIFTDYMYADIRQGDQVLCYSLSLAYADLPESLNADDLYALFVKACSDSNMPLEEARALVAEVRGNIAHVEQNAWWGGKDTNEFTISIAGSAADPEEFLDIKQYP